MVLCRMALSCGRGGENYVTTKRTRVQHWSCRWSYVSDFEAARLSGQLCRLSQQILGLETQSRPMKAHVAPFSVAPKWHRCTATPRCCSSFNPCTLRSCPSWVFFRPRSRETFQGLEELTKISSNSQNLTRSCSSKGRYRLPKTSAKTSLALNAASFAGKEKSRTEGWETQASLQSLRKCPYLRSASRRAKQCGSGHL